MYKDKNQKIRENDLECLCKPLGVIVRASFICSSLYLFQSMNPLNCFVESYEAV